MYKVANNNIHITRGETATYSANVIDKNTGAPFVLSSAYKNYYLVFGVRRSDYIKDGYAIKYNIKLTDKVLFDVLEVEDYKGGTDVWSGADHPPTDITKVALYKRPLLNGEGYDYRRWNPETKQYEEYEFKIEFPFSYSDTAKLSPKAYRYAMTIYGGNTLTITDDGSSLDTDTISYKKPLVDAQFIVEADINE